MKSSLWKQFAHLDFSWNLRNADGDKAYDSNLLDEQLTAIGIELIAPHKSNRVKPATQDRRALRQYRRRWKIECLNAFGSI